MKTSFGALRSPRIGGATVALASMLSILPATGVRAGGPACRVRNEDTGTHYDSLQGAVSAADPGDQIRVVGTCGGTTVIDRDLVLRGVDSDTNGQAILDGGRHGRVLEIDPGVVVEISGLLIRHGHAGQGGFGGGILNHGRLTLTDVVVTSNRADTGGGIYSTGTVTLNGNTTIKHNRTTFDDGGGVAVMGGRLIMNDSSSLHHNHSGRGGGGLYGVHAHLTLNASSSVHDNHATTGGGGIYADFSSTLDLNGSSLVEHNVADERGGGVFDNSSVTMNDASLVDDNTAGTRGGGIFRGCFADLTGARAGGNVKSNHPSNIANESACG
jgi:predicted outer membrane repeat protein